jgi:hypothetical protein
VKFYCKFKKAVSKTPVADALEGQTTFFPMTDALKGQCAYLL